ncbi:MAG TPA: O-antigen ligase family protein [Terriglobales bacterium]
MGVVIIPVIFWGFLCAQSKAQRHRLTLELCLAATLLMSSLSRAGIAAALVSCLLIMIAQRQYRLILIVALGGVAIAAFAVTYVPRPAELLEDSPSQSIASLFLYKGKPKLGLLGSRRGPWEDTLKVIKAHPWFGSGFGTSVTGESATYFELTRSRFVNSRMVREHGNSYLAIAEWSGLLGVVPFYVLVGSVMYYAVKVLIWLQRTGNISSAAVPASAIAIAGLIGAGFEDWLFAAGYYLCVFFWANAFILADLVNVREAMPSTDSRTLVPDPQFAPSMVAQ